MVSNPRKPVASYLFIFPPVKGRKEGRKGRREGGKQGERGGSRQSYPSHFKFKVVKKILDMKNTGQSKKEGIYVYV